MNDEQDLDPEQDAHVRALLAGLGSAPDETVPPEVAARLDETLAELLAERSAAATDEPGNVSPLRRRWSTRVAAAAAAVIVVGTGGVVAAHLGAFGHGSDDSATSAGSSSAGAVPLLSPKSPQPSAAAPDRTYAAHIPALSAATFDREVTSLVGTTNPSSVQGAAGNARLPAHRTPAPLAAQEDSACPGPATGQHVQHLVVLYDGQPAALLIHPERNDAVLVEAWSCQGGSRLNSIRVDLTRSLSQKASGFASPSPSP
jgi:hypothetical protein